MYKNHVRCRACGFGPKIGTEGIKSAPAAEKLIPVFDLAIQPLANDFATPSEPRAGYAPLKVMFCPRCTLAQLSVVVDPGILYSHYNYVTSPSLTMLEHFERLLFTIREEVNPETLLEIGSNDGALLRFLAGQDVTVAGIDPADNLAHIARKALIPTVTGIFSRETAEASLAISPKGFDVILARHVFCHVDDWVGFMDCLTIPSHRDTLACVEVPYVGDLLERGEFDTIYHEHLSYLNIKAMQALLADSAWRLQKIVRFPIHGGAILMMLRRRDHGGDCDGSVAAFEAQENITRERWQEFNAKAWTNIHALQDFVTGERKLGRRVVGYGASAKSTVAINACGFTRQDLEFITDTTPQKLWTLSPGSDIPIVDEDAILRELPDYAVCFAWNFKEEILAKNSLVRSKGVKFVFPIPSLEVV